MLPDADVPASDALDPTAADPSAAHGHSLIFVSSLIKQDTASSRHGRQRRNVCVDDLTDQPMSHNVSRREVGEVDVLLRLVVARQHVVRERADTLIQWVRRHHELGLAARRGRLDRGGRDDLVLVVLLRLDADVRSLLAQLDSFFAATPEFVGGAFVG